MPLVMPSEGSRAREWRATQRGVISESTGSSVTTKHSSVSVGGYMTGALTPILLAVVLVAGTLIPTQVFEALPVSAAAVDTAGGGADANEPITTMKVCTAPAAGSARCHARLRTDSRAKGKIPARVATPSAGTLGNGGAYDP